MKYILKARKGITFSGPIRTTTSNSPVDENRTYVQGLSGVEVTAAPIGRGKHIVDYENQHPYKPYSTTNEYLKKYSPYRMSLLETSNREEYERKRDNYANNMYQADQEIANIGKQRMVSGMKATHEQQVATKLTQAQNRIEWANRSPLDKTARIAGEAALALVPELIIGGAGKTIMKANEFDPSKLRTIANPLPVNPLKVGKGLKNFKSEINWAKWNKEIPKNKTLMQEYNAIEQQAKANGTWMKNTDGSAFKGTSEQFVQQNSENFKNAFPNPILNKKGNIQTNYHGTPQPLENSYFRKNTSRGEIGTGIYTTTDKGYANAFANSYIGKQTEKDISPTIYELYQNSNNPQLFYKEYYEDLLKKELKKFNIKTLLIPKFTKTYKTKSDIFNKNLSDMYSKLYKEGKLNLMPEYDSFTKGHQMVVPFNNYPKSATGNNGMFDMTNPNIYKSLLPIGIGARAYMSTTPGIRGKISTPNPKGNYTKIYKYK